jgi:hypothetical protein
MEARAEPRADSNDQLLLLTLSDLRNGFRDLQKGMLTFAATQKENTEVLKTVLGTLNKADQSTISTQNKSKSSPSDESATSKISREVRNNKYYFIYVQTIVLIDWSHDNKLSRIALLQNMHFLSFGY